MEWIGLDSNGLEHRYRTVSMQANGATRAQSKEDNEPRRINYAE
jgi:hypothetical protein